MCTRRHLARYRHMSDSVVLVEHVRYGSASTGSSRSTLQSPLRSLCRDWSEVIVGGATDKKSLKYNALCPPPSVCCAARPKCRHPAIRAKARATERGWRPRPHGKHSRAKPSLFSGPRLSALGSGCSKNIVGAKAPPCFWAPDGGGQSALRRAFRTRHDSPRFAAGYRTRPKSPRQSPVGRPSGREERRSRTDRLLSRAGGCSG